MRPIMPGETPPDKGEGPTPDRHDPDDRVEPPPDVGGWLTLLENLKDVRGPIAERTRRHARKRLRQAGWKVTRLRTQEARS